MKKKSICTVLAVSLVFVLSILVLTACNPKHTHTYDSTKWATDENNHWHPATCGHNDLKKDVAAHTFDEGRITVEPTEEADGEKVLTCTVCKYEKKKAIPKLDHTHKFDESRWETDDDYHWHPATCGHADATKDKAMHVFDAGVITTAPTETTEGVKTYTCEVCGKKRTESIGKLDHKHKFDMTRWEYDGMHHWRPATCGHNLEKKDSAEHTFSAWTVKTEAGIGVNRVEQRNCTVCGFHEERTIEGTLIPPRAREITVGAIDFTFNGKSQSIDSLVTVTNKEGGMTIEYCLNNGNDNWSQTAPIDAGNYKYKITLNGTVEWAHNEKVGEFTIKKFAINLDKAVYEINKGEKLEGGLFGVACVEVSAETNSYTDWVTVLAPEENNVPGRHVINVADLTTDEDNFTVKANSETITFVVYDNADLMTGVKDIFSVSSNVIVTTTITQGTIKVNDEIYNQELGKKLTVKKIEMDRKLVDRATVGDNVGMHVEGATKEEINRGQMLTKFGTVNNYDKFTIKFRVLTKEEGGRNTPISSGYKPTFVFTSVGKNIVGTITFPEGVEMVMPGETIEGATVSFDSKTPGFVGYKFAIREGGTTVGFGEITDMHFNSTELTLSSGAATSDSIYLLEGESREFTISLNVAKGKYAEYRFQLLNTTDLTMKVYLGDSELTLDSNGDYNFLGTGKPFTVKVVVTASKATIGNLKISRVVSIG